MQHYLLVLLILTPSSNGFFLGGGGKKRPSTRPNPVSYHHPSTGSVYDNPSLNEVDSYGSPSAPVITNYESTATAAVVDDSYGSPAAPVISYQEPAQSYSAPVKVKKSVQNAASTPPVQIEEIDDGYGAPLAPVVSASAPLQSYSEPSRPQYRRPKRHKKMNPLYMPVMSLLSLMPSYKPKRHIRMPLIRMPSFRMPRFRMPMIKRPTKIMPTFTTIKKAKTYPMKTHTPPVKYQKGPKLEFSGWKPISTNEYSPIPPEYPQPEPEIITIDNAHRHPKKYTPVEIVETGYAPEPITATPSYEDNTVYGVPPATYEIGHSAEIEPLFDSAPVQDLTSLAAVEEHDHTEALHYTEPLQYGGYSQVSPGYYQSTIQPNTLAQDVHSGSVYVQQPEQDLYNYSPQNQYGYAYSAAASPYPSYSGYNSSPAGSTAQASFNIHVNGQSHGFSHNFDHS